MWTGGLLTTIVAGVGVFIGSHYASGFLSPVHNPKPPSGPPVRVLTEAEYADPGLDGGTYYFATPLVLSAAQLETVSRLWRTDSIQGPSQYSDWMLAHGGVAANYVLIQLIVAGNRQQLVRITNITPVGTCTAPLTGTIMNSPSAGDDTTDYIAFNLDDKPPVAKTYINGGFGGSFFATTTVSLRDSEQHVFMIMAQTFKHYCQFRLQLTVLEGTESVPETVGNGSQPFRVSTGAPLAAYKEVYNGGVAVPDEHFVKGNPHSSN